MNKNIKKFYCLIFILFLSACNNKDDTYVNNIDIVSKEIDTFTYKLSEQKIDLNKKTPIFNSKADENITISELFFNENFIYYYTDSRKEEEQYLDKKIFKKKLNSNDKAEFLFQISPYTYGSSNLISVDEETYLKASLSEVEDPEKDNLFLYDFKNNNEEKIYTWSHNIPIVELTKIDSNNIIIHYRERIDTLDYYYYDLFNIKDKTSKRILTKSFDQNSLVGELPTNLIYDNNNIFIFIEKIQEDNNRQYYLENYDLNGQILKSYNRLLSKPKKWYYSIKRIIIK